MAEVLILIVILSAVAYRVGRLIALDTIWEGTRDKLLERLSEITVDGQTYHPDSHEPGWELVPLWRRKLSELITCPFCVTAYTSAGAVVLTRIFVGSFPMPVWVWVASWSGALLFWAVIDSD